MKITCPDCKQPVLSDQINVAENMACCRHCGEVFAPSIRLEPETPSFQAVDVSDPPTGTWYRNEGSSLRFGATMRQWKLLLFLVPFTLVWSGGSMAGIYGSQISSGEFSFFHSLFGLPFVVGSFVLVCVTLMVALGKVQIKLDVEGGRVFTGIGFIGWSKHFDPSQRWVVREQLSPGSNKSSSHIVMEGPSKISFGSGLRESHRYFLMHVLSQELASRSR